MALNLFPNIRSRLAPQLGTMNAVHLSGLPSTPEGTAPEGFLLTYQTPALASGATQVADATRLAVESIRTTGGINITAMPKPVQLSWSQELLGVLQQVAGAVTGVGVAPQLAKASFSQDAPFRAAPIAGRSTVGLFDDIWGTVQSAASGIFPTNQGIDWNNLLQSGVGLATQALAPRNMSVPSGGGSLAPISTMAAVPAIARGSAVVGRGFFNRFPALATAIQGMRNTGMNVSRAKLYGVMKRFGPEFLVTGGLLSAAAVNELAVAGPGYRRMNPANVRALRRSVRRIESFHRLCKTTDTLRRKKR